MTVTLKALGDGQLGVAKATLYTAPSAGVAKIRLVNTDVASRTVNLYVNKTGTSRCIIPKNTPMGAGEAYLSGVHTLETGDLIEGDASAATVVDYVIDGFEVT